MEGECKGSEKEEIITTDLNDHLQTRELSAQKEKKNKTNTQTKLNPQTLQTKTTKNPNPKSIKYQEKTVCALFKRKYPKD